jgi:hypothetical protein
MTGDEETEERDLGEAEYVAKLNISTRSKTWLQERKSIWRLISADQEIPNQKPRDRRTLLTD